MVFSWVSIGFAGFRSDLWHVGAYRAADGPGDPAEELPRLAGAHVTTSYYRNVQLMMLYNCYIINHYMQ